MIIYSISSAFVIVKPLPKETYLTPGNDLNMSITVSGSISSEDDVIISLGHSLRGVYKDITNYLVYELSEEDDMDGEERHLWNIDMTLPYPFSQASGDLILSVGDSNGGDVTTTRLIIMQEGKDLAPFFDPVPKSVKTFHGEDVFINAQARGSTPLNVSVYCIMYISVTFSNFL